jgi:ureidoacrylate peracid hydrolase
MERNADIYHSFVADPDGPKGIALSSWLDPARTALVIVDMQNYMTDRAYTSRWSADGGDDYYFTRLEQVCLPSIQKLLVGFRERGSQIVYLRIAYSDPRLADVPAGVSRKRLAEELIDATGKPFSLHEDDPASQIDPRIAPQPGDTVIRKASSGAFSTSTIDLTLRSSGISSLVFVGGITEGCVSSTLREAFDRGYLCTLVEDGCISSREENHNACVAILDNYFAWVVQSDELLSVVGV